MTATAQWHPARLTIDYPDRDLDRVSTALRLVCVVPIAIVLALIVGTAGNTAGESGARLGAFGGGVLVLPVLLTILFRNKYHGGGSTSTSSSSGSRPGCCPIWH